jgi:tripartite-type tricarboxylate transporter receptor subunit TctC
MFSRRRLIISSLAVGASAAAARSGLADIIAKPVRLIVGYPAGGATDVIARLLAEGLRGTYASTLIVENKPGAAGRLSIDFVKRSEPDGSTILITPDFPITVYPHSYRALNYDPLRDLVPVAPVAIAPLTLSVGPGVPADVKTVADFVAWCKANPGKAAYGTTSPGNAAHFAGLMLSNAAGVPIQPVHYRGGSLALQDVIGGHVPASLNPVGEALPLAQQGVVRILAVTGSRRSKYLPEIPTMREAGYDVVLESWVGVLLPSRTPPDLVQALSRGIGDAVTRADFAANLAKFGTEPTFQTPAEFAARVKAETERWGPVVKASGFVAED